MTRTRACSFEEALAEACRLAPAPAAERVALAGLVGRRLARPLVTRVALPPFPNSAMDGYALRSDDTPGRLALSGASAAGRPGTGRVARGQAWRVSTGALMPPGADAVARQEDVRVEGDRVVVPFHLPLGADVRPQGEDLAAGEEVLPAGAILAAHELGVAAAAGHDAAWCVGRVRVALLVAGDELACPGGELRDGEVFDANLSAIEAQARCAGARVVEVARVGDDPVAVCAEVGRLLDGEGDPPDLLVTAGGIASGPHDHLRAALRGAGVEQVVPHVGMRPGHPTWIGARGDQVVLALPGNPVAASLSFHVFGRPLLGHTDAWLETAPLAEPVRNRPGRVLLLRCRASAAGLVPMERQGSGALSSMAGAAALAWIPADAERLPAGAPVRVARLR